MGLPYNFRIFNFLRFFRYLTLFTSMIYPLPLYLYFVERHIQTDQVDEFINPHQICHQVMRYVQLLNVTYSTLNHSSNPFYSLSYQEYLTICHFVTFHKLFYTHILIRFTFIHLIINIIFNHNIYCINRSSYTIRMELIWFYCTLINNNCLYISPIQLQF